LIDPTTREYFVRAKHKGHITLYGTIDVIFIGDYVRVTSGGLDPVTLDGNTWAILKRLNNGDIAEANIWERRARVQFRGATAHEQSRQHANQIFTHLYEATRAIPIR
jgi:hypothetical protein